MAAAAAAVTTHGAPEVEHAAGSGPLVALVKIASTAGSASRVTKSVGLVPRATSNSSRGTLASWANADTGMKKGVSVTSGRFATISVACVADRVFRSVP